MTTRNSYWDLVWSAPRIKGYFDVINGTCFEVIVQNEDQVELSFKRMWDHSLEGKFVPLNIDKRFILLRGSSGFYSYGIYEHLQGWPDFDMSETRITFKLRKDNAFMVHQFACGNRKKPNWIFPKTRVQPNSNDCGYYVMKNMIDIASASVTKKWDEVFNDPTALSEDDLFSTSLLARPLFSVFRFFVHIGLEYMFTHSGLQAEFPPNTNILYVDLPFAELVGLSKNVNNIPLPGIVLNTRKPMVYVDQFGRQCRGSQLEALEIQPPPLILLPTVIAAFSNRRRSQAITDMHSAAFMGVSAAVHFLSLLFSVTNSLITITLLHHHRNPLFSTKKGQNQFQVLSISPSHHLINPLNFGK
ncbi:rhamnogalacturonan endolyase [Trifolium repens]|nr:rhamnogalacturonan endolyase [Trifolium repens]